MNDITNAVTVEPSNGFLSTALQNVFIRKLSTIQGGTLIFEQGEESIRLGQGEPTVTIKINNTTFWNRLFFGGQTAAGESYVDGDWDCDDLVTAMRLLLNNQPVYNNLGSGLAKLMLPFKMLRKWFKRNSRSGSKRNISAHYDLGNEFYKLWLDDTLSYSCALFEKPDMSLYQASIAKLAATCEKLELKKSDHLLEIGTGWGGLALYAATKYGCKVTTVTISKEQYELAKQRVFDAQLDHLITVELKDYRDIKGQYDKLVSIEMVEAVGAAYLNNFVERCGALLKPEGLLVIQGIIISERLFDDYKYNEDFIQKHIFPGGFLPSTTALVDAMTKTTDLRLVKLDDMGLDYALTLQHWRERFMNAQDALPDLGFDPRFVRLWEYYLCYCESGFHERGISAVQMKCVKPQWR